LKRSYRLSAVSYRPDGFALPVRAMDHFLASDLWPLTSLFCVAPWENVGPFGNFSMFLKVTLAPSRESRGFQRVAISQAKLQADLPPPKNVREKLTKLEVLEVLTVLK
jgi:hypothetical protein